MATLQSAAFGTLLKRYRRAASLTQEELAARAGFSTVYIGMLERGQRTPPPSTVQLLAEALALAPHDRAALQAAARRADKIAPPSTAAPQPLVGRVRELDLLERHLRGDGPPVLLLAGEPGIGKSRLLQEASLRAASYGLCVLEGGCQRRGGQEPYAPLLGALEQHIRATLPGQLRTMLRGCAWLVRLLPELAHGPIEPLPPWTLPPTQERRLVFDAVARFLTNVAGPAGTLLVLDDLQWAGPDALDLLATLARSAAEVPLRLVGAYRATEVQPQDLLSTTLADLAHAQLATHLALGPLAPVEAAQLLDSLLEGVPEAEEALRERVLQRADGVPFFLVSCARALGAGALAASAPESIPWDLTQSIRQRVAALPEAAREVLGVAAVLGRRATRALLTGVAARSEDEVLAALEAACRAQLLAEEDGHDTYQFTHDVIREVVEADVGAARRGVLHRRIAQALEREPGKPPIELLAYHYARSDARDKAALYLERAGDQARTQAAHAAAEGYYRQAVELLERWGRRQDAAAVREKLGAVLATTAHYDAALDTLEQAAATYEATGDVEGMRRTMAQIGQVHAVRGTPEEGVQRLRPLVEHGGAASEGLAALDAALAHLFFVAGRYDEQLAAADRAAELARLASNDRVLADAEQWRGLALLMLGRSEEALGVLDRASRLAEAVGDLASLCLALNNTAIIYNDRGEFGRGKVYLERALAVAERRGDPAQIALIVDNRGVIAFFTGEWDQARRDLERAIALSRRIGSSWASVYPLLDMGRLLLAEGAWEEAARYLDEGLALAEQSGDLQALRSGQSLLAERDLLDGHPDAACARLVPLLDRPGLAEHDVMFLLPLVAWAHLELGDVAAAGEVAAQAIQRARAENNRVGLVDALRVQGMVAMRQARWEQAANALGEALSLTKSMPCPYYEARVLHLLGLMRAQTEEPGPAREQLEAALEIFTRLGARKDAERVKQALRSLQR